MLVPFKFVFFSRTNTNKTLTLFLLLYCPSTNLITSFYFENFFFFEICLFVWTTNGLVSNFYENRSSARPVRRMRYTELNSIDGVRCVICILWQRNGGTTATVGVCLMWTHCNAFAERERECYLRDYTRHSETRAHAHATINKWNRPIHRKIHLMLYRPALNSSAKMCLD